MAEVVVERDLAEGVLVVVLGAALDHQRAQLVARLQRIDELFGERELGGVAAGRGEALRRLVDAAHDRAGRELPLLLDRVDVGLPEAAVEQVVGLERRRRRLVGDERLDRALEGADAHHVDGDAELVERVLVVVAQVAEAGDVDHAERVQVDLVGVRRDVVLALVVPRAPGDDLLAARLEAIDAGGDLAQRREAGRPHLVEDDDEARDLRIGGGGVEHGEDVAQQHLLHRLAAHLIERARAQGAGLLLADRAVEAQDERGLVGQRRRPALDEGEHDGDQDEQEDEVQDDAPADVDDATGHGRTGASGRGETLT